MNVIYIVLAGTVAWLGGVFLCTLPSVQRFIFYAHRIPIWWGQDLEKPETFGFLRNQVTPFYIPTRDGQKLFAWLVAPLRAYAGRERDLVKEPTGLARNVEARVGFEMLSEDPQSRLIIYFHGNAGTVGQTRRTDAYRMVSSGASDRIYVLAWDYRGFGKSSGTPIEDAMIKDTVDVLSWAMDTAKLSPDRIVLLAQSLGTALATAAASYFIHLEPPIEFGGMILCAGFTDTATVFMSYSPGGLVPLLAPLRLSSSSRTWFSRQLKDMWRNADRLADLVKASRKIRLVLFHATSDKVIPWSQSDALAYAAVNAASEGVTSQEFEATKQPIQLDEGGWINTWTFGDKTIQQRIVKHGGHNGIMKWAPVSMAVLETFGFS